MKRLLLSIMLLILISGLQAQKPQAHRQLLDGKQDSKELQIEQLLSFGQENLHHRVHQNSRHTVKQSMRANQISDLVNDSIYSYDWDIVGDAWKNNASWRSLYTYDSQGRQIGERYCERDGSGEWRDIYRSSGHYDERGNPAIWAYDNWDTITNAWIPGERDTMTYNSSNILTDEMYYDYNTVTQKWFLGEYYHYNDEGYELEFLELEWDNESFEITDGWSGITSRNVYNLPVEEIGKTFNSLTGMMDFSYKSEYTYINDTLIAQETESDWIENAWQDSWRSTHTYADGHPWQQLTENWDTEASAWVGESRTTYSYQDELLSVETRETWDISMQTWVYDTQVNYTYFPNKLSQNITYKLWNGIDWDDNYRFTYTYNVHGLMTEYVQQYWINNTAWADAFRTFISYNDVGKTVEYWYKYYNTNTGVVSFGWRNQSEYNENNQLLIATAQNWNSETADWQNSQKSVYYYSPLNGIDLPNSEISGCEFQNPYITGAPISCLVFKASESYMLSVYDMTGNLVIHQQISGNKPFSIDKSLPEGLYMLIINSQTELVYAKKIIIQRP